MRVWIVALFSALTSLATPALAGPLPGLDVAAPLFQGTNQTYVHGIQDYRLAGGPVLRLDTRTLVGTAGQPGDTASLQHRIASSMIDFYPLQKLGLHISAGMRFFSIYGASRNSDVTTRGLLYSPKLYGITAIRPGFRRKTPAATIGYSKPVFGTGMFGIEAGALMGRANNSMPRTVARLAGAGTGMRGGSGMNPIVNAVFGFRF